MRNKQEHQNVLRYISLGTQWAAMLGLAIWIGLQLDKKTGWRFPLFTVLLPLVALIFSLWKIIKEFSKPQKND